MYMKRNLGIKVDVIEVVIEFNGVGWGLSMFKWWIYCLGFVVVVK